MYFTLGGGCDFLADGTRREMLGGLEESFQSLEPGSKNMLNQVCLGLLSLSYTQPQAKTLAAKQTAKRRFQFS